MNLNFSGLKIFETWNNYKIAVMLDFVITLTSFQEGQEVLQQLLEKGDERFLEPTWLVQFVIGPVNILVAESLSMIKHEQTLFHEAFKKKLVWGSPNNPCQLHKLRLLLKFWYLCRYVNAMIFYSTNANKVGGIRNEFDHEQLLGRNLDHGDLKDFAVFLLYLPSEYQRWHDTYEFRANCLTRAVKPEKPIKLCDTRLLMHRSFVSAIDPEYYALETPRNKVYNHSSWDPCSIIEHWLENPGTFSVKKLYTRNQNDTKASSGAEKRVRKTLENFMSFSFLTNTHLLQHSFLCIKGK
jgi:hypothetical protein